MEDPNKKKMTEQFGGLPMESLIGGPLQAACNAEIMLAASVSDSIGVVSLDPKDEKTEGNT